MKFIVNSSDLNKGLSVVSGAVAAKASMPILETILFESSEGKLKLTASDLEITIVHTIEADFEEEGAVAVPARRMLETLRQLPNIPVSFEVDDRNNVTFRTDKGNYKLVGEEADEFPDAPDLSNANKITADGASIHSAIQKTIFAVSTDDLRPAMMGVYFDLGTKESKFVATDGHRLSRFVHKGIRANNDQSFIVPDKSLHLFQKTAESESCELYISQDHIQFKSDNTILISRLINEKYPNYESVIPRDNDKTMRVNKDQMLATVRRVAIFSSTTARQIRLLFDKDRLTIRAEDLDVRSEAKEVISCEYSGESMEIGFNAKYLADVLSNVEGEEVEFKFSSPNRAGVVKPVEQKENEEVLMLVMPVMLNTYA